MYLFYNSKVWTQNFLKCLEFAECASAFLDAQERLWGMVCPVARARCCGPYKTHPHVWLWGQQHSHWHHGAAPAKRTAGDSLHAIHHWCCQVQSKLSVTFTRIAKVCGPSDYSRSRNEARCELKLVNPFRKNCSKVLPGTSQDAAALRGVLGSLSSSASGWKLPPSPSFASQVWPMPSGHLIHSCC